MEIKPKGKCVHSSKIYKPYGAILITLLEYSQYWYGNIMARPMPSLMGHYYHSLMKPRTNLAILFTIMIVKLWKTMIIKDVYHGVCIMLNGNHTNVNPLVRDIYA